MHQTVEELEEKERRKPGGKGRGEAARERDGRRKGEDALVSQKITKKSMPRAGSDVCRYLQPGWECCGALLALYLTRPSGIYTAGIFCALGRERRAAHPPAARISAMYQRENKCTGSAPLRLDAARTWLTVTRIRSTTEAELVDD